MISGGVCPWGCVSALAPLEVGQMVGRCLRGCRYLWLLSRISSQQGQEVMNCRE